MGLKYAINNITRKKLLTFIIIIQLILGLFSSYLMINIDNTLKEEITKVENTFNGGNVFSITCNWDYYNFLKGYDTKKIFNEISTIQQVEIPYILKYGFTFEHVPKLHNKYSTILDEHTVYLDGVGINDVTIDKFQLKLSSGRFFSKEEYEGISHNTLPIILGNNFEKSFSINEIIDYTGLDDIGVTKLKVIGFLEKDSILPVYIGDSADLKHKSLDLNNMVLTTKNYLSEEILYSSLFLSSYLFLDDNLSEDEIKNIKNIIKEIFNKENIEVNVRSEKVGIDLTLKELKNNREMFFITSIVIIIFTSLTIILTFLNAIEVRKKEFGTYLLSGANRNSLIKIILYELVIINVIALLLFLGLCYLIFKSISLNIIGITLIFMVLYIALLSIAPIMKLKSYSIKDLIKGEE